ncbi:MULTISPECIES: ankyrin repeat domain-containing protein [unclassified Pseudoclavibacter]|uniref:ankyrin repeat domain-containing protein n=1 Tax=unclassified Pseudoclavibacter TaxID=2615177 RepID=UPI001BA6FC1F|nr:ankyrin repeat domain-containing protein [Pseudoclavibacter sp. Marseille-Q4354]MBS3178692.1 ankyrin repeat domain-containing protein [Pseudoclavibacter sp. Marseille-Q4354]
MPKKRITLPKEFRRGETYTIAELEEIFAKVETTALGRDSSKESALMSDRLDAAGIRWLIEHGAEVDAVDRFGNTALTHHSKWKAKLDVLTVLLEHGADPNITGHSSPLAAAAEYGNIDGLTLLLEAGADPLLDFGRRDETALDRAMTRMKDYHAPRALKVARILVARGATISGDTPKYLRQTMSQLQGLIARGKGSEENLAILFELFELLGVEPTVPPRVLAPGEPITVTAEGWKAQYSELWKMLVPGGGAAESVQGEVVRIAGRVGNEILGNGGGNWDKDFDRMLQAYRAHVSTGAPLDEEELVSVDQAVDRLAGGSFDEPAVDTLTELAVTWVLRNPERVDLPTPSYRR